MNKKAIMSFIVFKNYDNFSEYNAFITKFPHHFRRGEVYVYENRDDIGRNIYGSYKTIDTFTDKNYVITLNEITFLVKEKIIIPLKYF